MSKAFRFDRHGGPEVLRFEDVEVGAPGPGEVRIRNTAVAVNYRDVLMRRGIHAVKSFPSGIGLESAGVIDAVGPEVDGFAIGDRVACAGMPEGSYAELRIAPAARLIPLPPDIDERTAASMMIRGMTARSLLKDTYKVQRGDTIVIHAAAGGVGLIMCQWAKHLGATVIGTVSSDEKAKVARAHGCDHAIVYTREDFAERVREITNGEGVFRGQGDVRGLAALPAPARRDGLLRRSLGRSRSDAATTARRARLDLSHPSERIELHRHPRRAAHRRQRSLHHGGQRQDQDRGQQDLSPARRAARPRRSRGAQDYWLDRAGGVTALLRMFFRPLWFSSQMRHPRA
jgi:Alcohol dehydrogenase GroES-like domain/Zinc-binding dehydrogenase